MLHLKPRQHLNYLKKYLQIAGFTLLTATYATAASAQVSDTPGARELRNTAQYTYDLDQSVPGLEDRQAIQGETNAIVGNVGTTLIDPLGVITGCQGERLPSYEGFTVSLFDTNNRLTPSGLARLTPLSGNGGVTTAIGTGLNGQNSNPFTLTVGNRDGRYQFFLDPARGQLAVGRTYILVITPPASLQSTYGQGRQVLLEVIPSATPNVPRFRATPIDNQPIAFGSGQVNPEFNGDQDLNTSLSIVGFPIGICNPSAIQITKSADRAGAEPGDTVVYRLTIRNLSGSTLINLRVNDVLPLGFNLGNSVIARRADGSNIPVNVSRSGGTTTFTLTGNLATNETINIAYPVTLTPDAFRGNGTNSATVLANRGDTPTVQVQDGPALSRVLVRSGILSNTGTMLGRVFVDKNFDGEQQPNEPGIPNAVVYLDDGNRITTDANGMFSIRCVATGYRTGVLDLSSLNGYTLAPNLYFKERNSQSRLVKLAPGGMVRMNFGVTPTSREAK